jgi:hypothetical protein
VRLRNESIEDEQALFVPRWTTPAKVGRAILAAILVGLVAGGVISALALAWGWTILFVMAGLCVGILLVRDARAMPFDGGVWLTPTRIRHQWGGREWAVGWDDVRDPSVDPESGDVRIRTEGSTDQTEVVAITHALVMSGRALVMLIGALSADTARRARLGTDDELRRTEELRDLMDDKDFRPTVHGAPRISPAMMFGLCVVVIAVLLGMAALGRATTIDEDDLTPRIVSELHERGRDLRGVSCEDDLRKEVGATVKCHGKEAGQERLITVRVTAVEDDAFQYDLRVE